METAVGTPLTGSGAQELESWVQIPALQTSRLNASYKKREHSMLVTREGTRGPW